MAVKFADGTADSSSVKKENNSLKRDGLFSRFTLDSPSRPRALQITLS